MQQRVGEEVRRSVGLYVNNAIYFTLGKNASMSHPLMYVSGGTQEYEFPLILAIGREPNYDEDIDDAVGIINDEEFRSMSGGVWVTAYTQFAKQCFGNKATSRQLKNICFEKNASPIVFANAFPITIPNSVTNKAELRNKLIAGFPAHIAKIFNKPLSRRFGLVVQHGADKTEASALATELIVSECGKRGIPYCSSPFFYNGNSGKIQSALSEVAPVIQSIFAQFIDGGFNAEA